MIIARVCTRRHGGTREIVIHVVLIFQLEIVAVHSFHSVAHKTLTYLHGLAKLCASDLDGGTFFSQVPTNYTLNILISPVEGLYVFF